MPDDDRAQIGHELAARAATTMVNEGLEAGLKWNEIAMSCETVISIVVATVARMRGHDSAAFAQEMVDLMTERAHIRIQENVKKGPL